MPLAMFDLDGTLVDQAGAAHAWARGFAAKWTLTDEDTDELASALRERRPKGEVFRDIVRRFALPVDADALWNEYRSEMPRLVRCSDADLSALKELREAGWTLGIVTNGMVDNQEAKLRSTGIAELVDGWVISSEAGFRKPEPAIFQELARRLKHPLEGWMIGDSLEADVAGGSKVGLRTAWIAPEPATRPDPEPSLTAPTAAEAVRMILSRQPDRPLRRTIPAMVSDTSTLPPELTGSAIFLRPYTMSDAAGITRRSSDSTTGHWTNIPRDLSIAQARAWIRDVALKATPERPLWAIEVEGQYAGHIGLRPEGDGGHVHFDVLPEFRGQGVASTAVTLVSDWALSHLTWSVVIWRAHVGNMGSLKTAQNAGFSEPLRVPFLLELGGRLVDGWYAVKTSCSANTGQQPAS